MAAAADQDRAFLPNYDGVDKVSTSDPTDELPIKLAQKGLGAAAPTTVVEMLNTAVSKRPDDECYRVERNGKWEPTTWSQYNAEIRKVGKALMHFGMERFGSVSVIGFNSPEWFQALVGSIVAGGKTAGMYTTNGPEACEYIINHSKSSVVFCDNRAQVDKIVAIQHNIPTVRAVVAWEEDDVKVDEPNPDIAYLTWPQFLAAADKTTDDALEARMADQRPGHVASLIYTSGTTGSPKAVMVTHDSLTWTAKALVNSASDFGQRADTEERMISYLPLSHVAAQILDIISPIVLTATLRQNCRIIFARPDALKGSLGITLKEARPTFFFGVPRVWEKFQEKMRQLGASTTGIKKKISTWAKGVGAETWKRKQVGGVGSNAWGYSVANAVVFSKIKAALGFTETRYFATSAAPIGLDTLEYFASIDIPIMEAFGMSECCGPHSVTQYDKKFQLGSVGVPLEGTEVNIDHVEGRDKPGEGEMAIRGRHVMAGYMYNPEKTQEAISADGWLRSGDVGRLDEYGMLFITGRIKELLITAGGENVAPVPIEQQIKALCPALSNIVLIGDKKKYLTILVSCAVEMTGDGAATSTLVGDAVKVDAACKTTADAQKSEAWKKYIESAIKTYNKTAVSKAQHIQYFTILDTDFSVPDDTLTSTLKLKRPIVNEKYAAQIESMYQK